MKNEIECLIKGRSKDIGITVKRVLPFALKRMVGPFIFLDEMGPTLMRPPKDHMDVRPHPHIGLSTLTFLFEGKIMHKDSLGVQQLIVPGEVNWMTAGKGISHSEREPTEIREHERSIHGLQFWVALPKDQEDVEPSFHHYEKEDTPEFEMDNLQVKLVAGEAFGKISKLKNYSPMTFMVMTAEEEGTFSFKKDGHENALYVVKGHLTIGDQRVEPDHLVVFKKNSEIEVNHSPDALFALIGGEAFPEPRYIWWNLVSSDPRKIVQAKKDWDEGNFPMVPGDPEKIPSPNDPLPQVANYP